MHVCVLCHTLVTRTNYAPSKYGVLTFKITYMYWLIKSLESVYDCLTNLSLAKQTKCSEPLIVMQLPSTHTLENLVRSLGQMALHPHWRMLWKKLFQGTCIEAEYMQPNLNSTRKPKNESNSRFYAQPGTEMTNIVKGVQTNDTHFSGAHHLHFFEYVRLQGCPWNGLIL